MTLNTQSKALAVSVNRISFTCVLILVCAYAPLALACTFVEKFSLSDSRHVFIGRIVSKEPKVHDDRTVISLEVDPLVEFTPEGHRLGRNYQLFPTAVDSACNRFYVDPQPYTEEQYRTGNLVSVYGLESGLTELGDLAVGTHQIDLIRSPCDEVDMTKIPSEESFDMACLSDMFHVYRVLALLPTASDNEIDRALRWLSDSWYQLPYEILVEKYADAEKAEAYLNLRYGDLLDSDCDERPKMLPYFASKDEKNENSLYRKRWFEYCEARSETVESAN